MTVYPERAEVREDQEVSAEPVRDHLHAVPHLSGEEVGGEEGTP